MVRYSDDFVILCRSQSEAETELKEVQQWTADAGLKLHPVKTRIVDATTKGGFGFLGYHFENGNKPQMHLTPIMIGVKAESLIQFG